MKNQIIIGVDTGNRCIKTKNFNFTSGLVKHTTRPAMTDDYVKYKGCFYTLTDDRLPYMEDKSENEDFFILTLFAIAKELRNRQIECSAAISIGLAVGLPPAHIGRLKDNFVKYFKREFVNFEYGSSMMLINIEDVYLYPQGFSAILPYFGEVAKVSKAYIIDIGGYTTDVILLRNGDIDLSFCESFDMGVIEFFNEVKMALRKEFRKIPDESQIESAIKQKERLYGNMTTMINEEAKRYTDKLLKTLNESGVDLFLSKIFFIGGGSLLFKEFLDQSDYLNDKQYITDVSANADGYEYLANLSNI